MLHVQVACVSGAATLMCTTIFLRHQAACTPSVSASSKDNTGSLPHHLRHQRAVLLQSEAYNTLFVARVSHETTEKKLKREFEEYGPIRSVVLVHDKQGKCCHYCHTWC